MGVLALSSGESELAAVVRAATEGLRITINSVVFEVTGPQTCTFEGPDLQQHHQNSTRRPPREGRKKECGGTVKNSEILSGPAEGGPAGGRSRRRAVFGSSPEGGRSGGRRGKNVEHAQKNVEHAQKF